MDDGWVDGWINELVSGWMDEQMAGWLDGWVDEQRME